MSVVAAAVVVSMFRCCDVVLCLVARCDQDGWSALLLACEHGHLDVARWLATHAGSDARSERDAVSCRCSCRRLCVSLLCRERRWFVLGVVLWSVWPVSPSGDMLRRSP
jgi:hypothetical protein